MKLDRDTELMNAFFKLFFSFRPKKIQDGKKPFEMLILKGIIENDRKNSSITPTDICNEFNISKSAVTFVLNSLEKNGYIIRKIQKQDRRKTVILPTKKAKDNDELITDFYKKLFGEFYLELGKDDADKLIEYLSKANDFFVEKMDNK